MEQTEDEAPFPLLDLPSELLVKCLVGAGYKSICAAAMSCSRLRKEVQVFQALRVLASAMSTKADMTEAIKDACMRALQGMLGFVTFALVFVSGYKRDQMKQMVDILQECLPADTAIMGMEGKGLMGVGADGSAVEIDPSEKAAGVSLLLGHLPDVYVRMFACSKAKQQHALQEAHAWLGASEPGLTVHCATLLTKGSGAGLLALDQPGDDTLQALLLPGSHAVVGGIAAGSEQLFMRPSSRQPEGPATSLARARIVGMALCTSSGSSGSAGPAAEPAGDSSAAQTGQQQGTAGGSGSSSGGSKSLRAAALSVHGYAASQAKEVWHGVELQRRWGTTQSGEEAALLEGGISSDSSRSMSLPTCVLAAAQAREDPSIALWTVPADQPLLTYAEATLSGRPLVLAQVLSFVEGGRDGSAAVVLQVDHDEAGDLDRMMKEVEGAQRHRLCCQVVAGSGPAALEVMRRELPLLRSMCQHDGGEGGEVGGWRALEQEWRGVLQRSALAVGARSGSAGLSVFSCTGRGRSMHKDAAAEAAVIDQALQRGVPFAGAYCNGELGPIMKAGYCGWGSSGEVAGQEGLVQAGRGAAPTFMPSVLQGFTTMFGLMG